MTESDRAAEPAAKGVTTQRVGRRTMLAGLTGLGLAGALGVSRVLAQEATPTPPDSETEVLVPGPGAEFGPEGIFIGPDFLEDMPEIGAAYDNFVSKLAANLGQADTAAVDTAIRDALKAMVDEQFDEGNISRNLATELKERIDASEAPLMVAMLGGMGLRRAERRRRRDEDDDVEPSDDPATDDSESTPTI